MDDDRDYIERTQSRALNYTGKEFSPDEMAREFAKHDIDTRVDALESLSAERGELSAREAAKRRSYVSGLRSMHDRLRKVGR